MDKLSLKIAPMEQTDINDIIAIEEASYGAHHWSKDSFYAELTNSIARYYVAKDENGTVLGYVGSWFIIEEAHITNISVSPEHRGKGIGEALLYGIIQQCYKERLKYITLEVRVGNEVAINLYKKYNFNSLGLRKNYYQDNGEDALIMWTENIFWDKFKTVFEENSKKLNERLNIL